MRGGSSSMLVEVSSQQWLNLNTLWKRPICELLQEWRKNLASLVFFIFLLINLVGVTFGTTPVPDSLNRTALWGGRGYAGYSGIKGGIPGAVSLADVWGGKLGPGGREKGAGYSVVRGKRDTPRRHNVSGKDKGRSSHHHSTNQSVDSNTHSNVLNNHHRQHTKGDCDRPVTSAPLMDNQDSISLGPSYKNHSDSIHTSSQCLPHTTNTTQQAYYYTNVLSSICNTTGQQRTKEVKLPFCSMFSVSDPVENLDELCQDLYSNSSQEYIKNVLEREEIARSMALRFEMVFLRHFDCRDPEVPRRWNCTDCESAYKNWLCSITMPVYRRGVQIPPCGDYCEQVQRVCPYLLPELDSQYMGQPSFLCTVPEIPHQITAGSTAEVSDSTCHQPCQKGETSICVPGDSARKSRDTDSSSNQTPSLSPKSKHVQSQDEDHIDNQMPVLSSDSDSSKDIENHSFKNGEIHDSAKQTPQGGTGDNVELWESMVSSSSSIDNNSHSLTTAATSGVRSAHTKKHRQHYMAACLAQLFTVLFLAQHLCIADVFSILLATRSGYT